MKIGHGDITWEITEEDFKSLVSLISEGFIRLHLPRNKKNKIGIVIAIRTENNKEKVRLQNDLVSNLKKYLQESGIPPVFNIFYLPENHTKKIHTHKEASKYLDRTRGHFIVYGAISERQLDGKNQFVFRLEGSVRHRPIPQVMQDQFTREFTELFPRKWNFPETEEMLGFEITHQWLGFVMKYILGIASFVSGDFELSLNIFTQLKVEIGANLESKNIPAVIEIRKRLPRRIVEVCTAMNEILYYAYTKSRNKDYIIKQKPFLDLLMQFSPLDYRASLSRAIYIFLIENDTKTAKKELTRANHLDSTWRVSLAFLLAYEGNLDDAKKQCDKAFKEYMMPNVYNDAEVFIADVLEKEPEKIQLYFIRGYINLKAKGDGILAKKDFEKFLEKVPADMYSEEVRLTAIYIKELKNIV